MEQRSTSADAGQRLAYPHQINSMGAGTGFTAPQCQPVFFFQCPFVTNSLQQQRHFAGSDAGIEITIGAEPPAKRYVYVYQRRSRSAAPILPSVV
jgi:hypothetical protein